MTIFKDIFMTEPLTHYELLTFTTEITSAYISNNTVAPEDLSSLIQRVYQSISETSRYTNSFKSLTPLNPAVPIEESVTDEYIVCLEDGKKLQMLKRHLNTVYKMTVDQYRERWGLPSDYPVVSPNYAKRRSQIAKNTGLGISGRRRKLKVMVSPMQEGNVSQMAVLTGNN